MYIMTLEINQKCNLKCKYCYLGKKNGSKMEISTGLQAIDLAFRKVEIHKDKKIWFDFVGGEAFLDFGMIKQFVSYIENKNVTEQKILKYSITTNATLFTREIIDYLVEKDFSLKVSIDGDKEVNDLNRISRTGYSVHDKIVSNIKLLRDFEIRTSKVVQVTNVVTNNNYKSYFNSIKYIVGELGFKLIDTGIDYYSNWTEEEKIGLESEIKKVFKYFIERATQGNGFRWSFLDSLLNMKKKREKFYSCGAGIISVYVRYNGSLFACPGNLDDSVKLGDINVGFDKSKIDWLKNFNDINNEKCHNCVAFSNCDEKSCVMMNVAKTGSPDKPSPMLCWTRLLMYRMYLENKEILSRVVM